MVKKILGQYGNDGQHWVGDDFPVHARFSYTTLGAHISPFLLVDYAGPYNLEPTKQRLGVGIVYDGKVEHRDSAGNGGVIGPGDVQWMTAASGHIQQEYHSPAFARAGGSFPMVQLW